MNKKIQITAILMALAIFGLCALIAPVCASEVTDAEEAVAGGEGNETNNSEAADNATVDNATVDDDAADNTAADDDAADDDAADDDAADNTAADDDAADNTAADDDAADNTAADDDAADGDEASPGFGIVGVMISIAVLFLLIRKKA